MWITTGALPARTAVPAGATRVPVNWVSANAAVDNGYAWLGIVIVVGSAVSLAYYLRVVAAVWMRAPSEAVAPLVRSRPVIAGGSPEADDEARAAGRTPGSDTATIVDYDAPEPARAGLRQPEVVFVAVVCALVTLALGIYPEPLFDIAKDAGSTLFALR